MSFVPAQRRVNGRRLHVEQLEPKHLLTTFTDLPQIFAPLQDAHIEGGVTVDKEQLVVAGQASTSDAHLRFNVTGFSGQPIPHAKLRLQATADVAAAELELYRGSPQSWTERGLDTVSAPTADTLLDVYSGGIATGEWIEFDVSAAVLGNGSYNFVLRSVTTGDEVSFAARESDEPAQLLVVSNDAVFPGDFNADGFVNASDYTIWRDNLGSSGDLRADANGNNVIDTADYSLWQANYRAVAPPITAASVTDYGATPDDATFDHAAVQQALDENASVFLPAGEYWVDAKLFVPKGRRLFGPATGDPAVIRVRHDSGSPSGNNALELQGDNVTLQNFVIDKDFVDGSYGVGVFADNRDNTSIFGLEIQDYSVRYGIHIIESDNFEIDSIYVHNFLMNEGGSAAADMIQDSPAGVRITRSTGGSITNSRIHDIEVGPLGRASISELVPSYGPQGYQSDGITLSDSSQVLVENNNIWNSGELIDLLVSDNITVKNNVMQMAFGFAVKVIGSQNSVVEDNYVADGAIGLWMGDHSTGEQATGNLIDGNDFVNNGSIGVYNESANSRLPFAISGIYVDNDADGNTVSNNDIYNFHGYLLQFIRQGTGANMFTGNDTIATEFGPAGGGDAQIIGQWTAGLTHEKKRIEQNRALMFFTYAEDADTEISATAVTYGGQSLTKKTERIITVAGSRIYVSAWELNQDRINMAAHGNFDVTWISTPDSLGYSSVFLANVYQPELVFSEDTGAQNSGNNIQSSPRATHAGDLVLSAVAGGNPGNFTATNGFTEALEIDIPNADGMGAYKVATGADEFGSATHTNLGGGVIYTATMRRNPAMFALPVVVDVTTLGIFPDDGINDAVRIQSLLNNPAIDELYFPPGTYHVDRPVFVPSNKAVRGDEVGVSRIETLVDTTVFRIDDFRVNATIANFTIERPQNQDSDNEIIRADNTTFLTVDSVTIVNSASRAPMINVNGGANNTVINSKISDYQVIRTEENGEKPGLFEQIFGVGINFSNHNSNVTVANNQVIQNTIPNVDFENSEVLGIHQSGGIQVIDSVGGTTTENYVFSTGQGMDVGASSFLTISGNYIDESHIAGIKLVNNSNNITIEDNYVSHAGHTGIWLSTGNHPGGSWESLVRNNTLVGIGDSHFALGFWDGTFGGTSPAAIHLQAGAGESFRVRNNLIQSNNSYDNDLQVGIVVAEPGTYRAYVNQPFRPKNNVATNNVEQPGPAPPPPFAPAAESLQTEELAFASLRAPILGDFNADGFVNAAAATDAKWACARQILADFSQSPIASSA